MTIPQGYAAARLHPGRAVGLLLFALMLAITAFLLAREDTLANLDPAVFELDRNIEANNATPAAHDWSQVFAGSGHDADRARFLEDATIPLTATDDQPATGATKDTNDIDGWDCKEAGLSPPKNDMANAFVASYTVTVAAGDFHGTTQTTESHSHQLIYFGLDRIDSDNGNANVGFWILKKNHTCDASAGTATWTGGKHSLGDTLIVSEFTGGGGVSTIQVFVWCSDPASPDLKCGSSTNLTPPAPGKGDGPLQLRFSGADCLTGTNVSALACATVNVSDGTLDPPWPYVGAIGSAYERGAFFEGGIDATGLGLDLRCAGTFVANTRSSQSTTAQMHDFSIGQVDLCSATLSTTSSETGSTVVPGTSVTDTATLTPGAGQPTPTGTIDFFLCQPADVTTGGCEGTAGSKVGATKNLVNGSATSDAATNTTAIGKYCWRAVYTPAAGSPYSAASHTNTTTECFTTVKQPSTTVTTASPSGTILAGQSVSDTATVSGGAGQPTPTGTVKFFLCQPNEITAGGCEGTAGTQIGTPAAGETLNGTGVATSESTSNTTAVGTYCWRAEYSGDGFYLPSSHTNALTTATGGVQPECFTTFNPSTVISIADRIVGLPTDATGSVTYAVFTDSACTTAVTTGTPSNGVITPATNSVGAGGVAPLSDLYTPAAPGTFYIKAVYTGTGTYAGVVFTSCTESATLAF